MSYVGHGWRSGQAGDAAVGNAPTTTVSSLTPPSGARGAPITLTVTGTGYTVNSVIYANYSAIPTQFMNSTQVRSTSFNPIPDSGNAGPIPIGVRNPGERISNTVVFTAT